MDYKDLAIFSDIPTLRTERLILRKMERYDLDDVFEYASDPLVSKYLLWYPHEDKRLTKEYLKLVERNYKKKNFFDWGVSLAESGKLIGTCGFSAFNIINNSAEIGYVLGSGYWGNGYAKEAVDAVLNFGFNVLLLNRIEAKIMSDNYASKVVAKKCGMRFEGVNVESIYAKGRYIDVDVFAITKSEYKKLISE